MNGQQQLVAEHIQFALRELHNARTRNEEAPNRNATEMRTASLTDALRDVVAAVEASSGLTVQVEITRRGAAR